MDMQTLREIQGYGFFFFVVFAVVTLYGYYFYLYKSERSGKRNYEQYSKLVLNDDINGEILESAKMEDNVKKEK